MHFVSSSPTPESPSAEQVAAWNRRTSQPENEAPAALDFSSVLGRTDDTVVILSGFRVYSTGLAFTLSVRLRRDPSGLRGHRIFELVSGHSPSVENLDDLLLLGVEYADGRMTTTLTSSISAPNFHLGDPTTIEPLLHGGSGSGGGRVYEHDFWLSPLPPAGPLTFVCRWPGFGIDETSIVLDGTRIPPALARVETLWPWEPSDDEPEDDSPPELEYPTDGWFGAALRRR